MDASVLAAHSGTAYLYRRRTRRGSPVELSGLEVLMVGLAVVSIVAAALLPGIVRSAAAPSSTHTVVIRADDTLWSVAQDNPVPGRSTAETVTLIRRMNGLRSSPLVVGQALTVPARDAVSVADSDS